MVKMWLRQMFFEFSLFAVRYNCLAGSEWCSERKAAAADAGQHKSSMRAHQVDMAKL